MMMLKTLGPEAEVKDVKLGRGQAVIVRDVLDTQTVDQFNEEVMPYIERTPWGEMISPADRRSAQGRWRLGRQPVEFDR